MAKYLYRSKELRARVGPEQGHLQFLSCERIELDCSQSVATVRASSEEVALVCLEGRARFRFDDRGGLVGVRDLLYLPRHSEIVVQGDRTATLIRIGAPSDRDTRFALIRFSEVDKDPSRHKIFGSAANNSLRDVYMCLDDQFDASRLLVGIGQGNPGGWTVWPPHEHGAEKEELYVFFDMGAAFAIQCVYENLDQPLFCGIVRNGDMVAVARGFHPNVSCPGGRISYVYAMAARVPDKRTFMALHFQKEFGDTL